MMEIATSSKSSGENQFKGAKMAIFPNPDRNSDLMYENLGTKCLITDYGSERYLKSFKYNVPQDRYSRPCGGSYGFDDFVERWHE